MEDDGNDDDWTGRYCIILHCNATSTEWEKELRIEVLDVTAVNLSWTHSRLVQCLQRSVLSRW